MSKISEVIDVLYRENTVKFIDEQKFNVDIERTISDMEIKIDYLEDSMSDIHGLVRIEDNGKVSILVNPDLPDNRKKFTLAHELGHALLHFDNEAGKYEDSVFYREDTFVYNQEEKEANDFAGSLLMPAKKFKSFVYDNQENNRIDLKLVAETFGVSLDAASVRAKFLGILSW